MAAKEWLVPLLVGVAAFAGLSFLPEPHASSGEHPEPALVFPFTSINVTPQDLLVRGTLPGAQVTLPVPLRPALAAGAPCPALAGSSFEGRLVTDFSLQLVCVGPGLAEVPLRGFAEDTSFADARGHSLAVHLVRDAGPRFGVDGYNATRLTVHVFDAAGELIASNAGPSEQARLTGTYAPEQLPSGLYYLGADATPPPGTEPLPRAARLLVGEMRPLLQGLPVGGVASTSSDALQALYGRLYITAQVDELAPAP